ncbi:unnamed protein product [Amoebophrya sp. A120]|nr:unnamed protein product [Amoebophrya sp. A120]|eukprot:GSA120T00024630001.1
MGTSMASHGDALAPHHPPRGPMPVVATSSHMGLSPAPSFPVHNFVPPGGTIPFIPTGAHLPVQQQQPFVKGQAQRPQAPPGAAFVGPDPHAMLKARVLVASQPSAPQQRKRPAVEQATDNSSDDTGAAASLSSSSEEDSSDDEDEHDLIKRKRMLNVDKLWPQEFSLKSTLNGTAAAQQKAKQLANAEAKKAAEAGSALLSRFKNGPRRTREKSEWAHQYDFTIHDEKQQISSDEDFGVGTKRDIRAAKRKMKNKNPRGNNKQADNDNFYSTTDGINPARGGPRGRGNIMQLGGSGAASGGALVVPPAGGHPAAPSGRSSVGVHLTTAGGQQPQQEMLRRGSFKPSTLFSRDPHISAQSRSLLLEHLKGQIAARKARGNVENKGKGRNGIEKDQDENRKKTPKIVMAVEVEHQDAPQNIAHVLQQAAKENRIYPSLACARTVAFSTSRNGNRTGDTTSTAPGVVAAEFILTDKDNLVPDYTNTRVQLQQRFLGGKTHMSLFKGMSSSSSAGSSAIAITSSVVQTEMMSNQEHQFVLAQNNTFARPDVDHASSIQHLDAEHQINLRSGVSIFGPAERLNLRSAVSTFGPILRFRSAVSIFGPILRFWKDQRRLYHYHLTYLQETRKARYAATLQEKLGQKLASTDGAKRMRLRFENNLPVALAQPKMRSPLTLCELCWKTAVYKDKKTKQPVCSQNCQVALQLYRDPMGLENDKYGGKGANQALWKKYVEGKDL